MNWLTIKDTILKYGFLVATAAVGLLYYLYDRRGRQLAKTIADTQKLLLEQKLLDIEQKSQGSEKEYEMAKKEYESILRRHGRIIDKLRVGSEDSSSS